ncbi:hypothetical protein ACTI_12620 [Actinoplanes sp. OR16]|uniref:hypothetical protein n=1 Tax=Actinoplanes sp. OR16 TaxID=946334 RepID=UPI000F6DFBAD|nr:hypothetical protein [Actinoplanes sp. OR16]BBH64577.1 hypothetical protein ACTI_12620 [Actinoplanes sp. OR16]
MSTLEGCYRRLLRVYPAGHRAVYEEEMIAVLMTGSAPGRRLPSPAEVVDLLRAGLLARTGGSWRGVRDGGRRDAAAVAGLVVAVMMAAVAGRRLLGGLRVHLLGSDPMEMFGIRGLLLLDVSLRFALWAAVAAAALAGLRRTASWLVVPAAVVELGAVLWWLPSTPVQSSIRLSWSVVTTGVAVAALVLARHGRPLPAVLGRRGVGVVLVAGGAVLTVELLAAAVFEAGYGWPVRIFELVLFLLIASAVLAAPPGVRGRAVVLLVPAFAGPITWELAQRSHLLTTVDGGSTLVAQMFVVLAAPMIAFAAGLAVLRLWSVSRAGGEAKEEGHE